MNAGGQTENCQCLPSALFLTLSFIGSYDKIVKTKNERRRR